METRIATINDAKEIARIHVETWQKAYAGIIPKDYLNSLSKINREIYWKEAINTSEFTSIVALNDLNNIIGFSSYGPCRDLDGENRGELYAIYLDFLYCGLGYGEIIIDTIIRALVRLGYREVSLWVLEKNTRAIKFYEKIGFIQSNIKKTIEIKNFKLVEVQYIRSIREPLSKHSNRSGKCSNDQKL